MESRRKFLKTSATALGVAAAASTKPMFAWQGANNKIRMAVIGCGGRAARVFDSFNRHQSDITWVGACEVNESKLNGFMNPARQTFKLTNVVDYRRILDRNDVDAVLIGTPDFSHARIAVDAMNAGKDVYVEKPASNNVARINAMLDAQKKTGRIVQVGTQQRSWDYFQDAKKFMDSGAIGAVRQVVIMQPGAYASAHQDPAPVPPGLDWDMWQLKGLPLGAPERPYAPNRTNFRSWYEYGSGLIGDWGAHHIDIAHWFMNADGKGPIKTAAVGHFINIPTADPEMVPDTFSISWEYDTFMMSFQNGVIPRTKEDGEGWGTYFIGQAGTLHVNRMGWSVMPTVGTTRNIQPVPPTPTLNNVPVPDGAAAGAGAGGAGGRGGGRAGGGAPAAGGPAGAPGAGGRAGGAPGGGRGGAGGGAGLEKVTHLNPKGGVEEDYPLDVHTQNFIDCVRSKKAPNASMEIGHSSALPALLALESLKTGKMIGWDPATRQSKVL